MAKKKTDTAFSADRVTLCQDGKYRWVYDFNLFTNPSVYFDLVKVLLVTTAILGIIFVLILSCTGDFRGLVVEGMAKGLGLTFLILVGLSVVGYIVYAIIVGGKYTVLFTLDVHTLVHQEYGKTLDKARLIGQLTALAGAAGGRIGGIGAGMMAASCTTMTTELKHVRRVVPRRWMNTIKVNQLISKNRVYTKKEDFDFVYQFLCQHCVNRKK